MSRLHVHFKYNVNISLCTHLIADVDIAGVFEVQSTDVMPDTNLPHWETTIQVTPPLSMHRVCKYGRSKYSLDCIKSYCLAYAILCYSLIQFL